MLQKVGRNASGFTSTAVMLLALVSSIAVYALAQMVFNQSAEIKRIQLKVALKDVQLDVEQALGFAESCRASFPYDTFSFDETSIGDASYTAPVQSIVEVGTTNRIIAQMGPLEGTTETAQVERLFANNFVALGADHDLNIAVTDFRVGTVGNVKITGIQVRTDPSSAPLKKPVDCWLTRLRTQSSCRMVVATVDGSNGGSWAGCGSDEQLISGGGSCRLPNGNPMDYTTPPEDRGYAIIDWPGNDENGWVFECYNYQGEDRIAARAFAYCFKK